jgi:integrase
VLTREEGASLFQFPDGEVALMAKLLFGTDIRTVQEPLGHSDVSITMIYPHMLKVAAGGTASPLDVLSAA